MRYHARIPALLRCHSCTQSVQVNGGATGQGHRSAGFFHAGTLKQPRHGRSERDAITLVKVVDPPRRRDSSDEFSCHVFPCQHSRLIGPHGASQLDINAIGRCVDRSDADRGTSQEPFLCQQAYQLPLHKPLHIEFDAANGCPPPSKPFSIRRLSTLYGPPQRGKRFGKRARVEPGRSSRSMVSP